MVVQDWKILKKQDRVTKICDKCGKEQNISVANLRRYKNEKFCKLCTRSFSYKGMSEETKKKISLSRKGKGFKKSKEAIERLKGENNPFFGRKHSEESKKKMVLSRQNNPDYRKNFLEGLKKRDLSGSKNGMFGKPPAKPKRSKLKYKDICFRSSWELNFAKYLDELKTPWTYEEVTLPLGSLGGYTPDFIVDNIIYEIKGYYWNDDSKFLRAKELYSDKYTFILLDQTSLKNLGVL
jgi:hypothetical protein